MVTLIEYLPQKLNGRKISGKKKPVNHHNKTRLDYENICRPVYRPIRIKYMHR